jgi:hypothetical protein
MIKELFNHLADEHDIIATDEHIYEIIRIVTPHANKLKEFRRLAIKVRSCQKEYFKNRNQDNLTKSKIAESELDNLIKEFEPFL